MVDPAAVSLRAAIGVMLLAGCARLPLADPLPPPQPPLTLAADLHLHFSISRGARPFFKGEAGSGPLTTDPRARLRNQIGEPQMHASGLRLALGALWPPFDVRPGRDALGEALDQVSELRRFTQRHPGFAVVSSAARARAVLAQGRIAILPQLEGGEGIEQVDDVDRLWAAGVRAITLEHFSSSALGGAAKNQMLHNIFGVQSATVERQGLTPLGRAAVERMMALGIVIDLAHSSDAVSRDVLDLTEARGVPVINSHSPARALHLMERAIPDELAARIGRGGGLLGATVFDGMVAHVPESERWPGFVPGSCDDVIAHWVYLAKVAGPEHVALGSDFNGFITRPGPGGSCPNGLRNIGDLPDLFAALEAHGIPRAALDGMGQALLTLVETVEAKADPVAQAKARQVRTDAQNLFSAP